MAAFANYLFSSSPRLPCSLRRVFTPVSIKTSNGRKGSVDSRRMTLLMRASDSSVSGFSAGDENPRSEDRAFYDLIRDIEPLDVSLIQKDVPLTTVDAMKRTISGMLGLLPSEQFQVTVEALWKPIFKLLVSSLMTGYTLRNAEYRLSLERNLEIFRVNNNGQNNDGTQSVSDGQNLQDMERGGFYQESFSTKIPDFDKMAPDVQQYISDMHSRLSSLKKELHDVKRKSAALQMQQFVGEEKNDLLDYLRSLEPEKVAELSEPTSPELKETIDSVVHGLLATLSPKMQSKGSEPREGSSIGTMKMESEGDHIDLVEDTSLHFEPLISLPRDYLARLLFWCMLLGHYLRGLEYRVELTELLSVPCSQENDAAMTEQDA